MIHFQSPKLLGKVEHLLDTLLDAVLPGGVDGEGDVVGDPDDAGVGHGAVAAAQHQQLAPRVDQQSNLVVYQNVLEQRQALAPLDQLVESLARSKIRTEGRDGQFCPNICWYKEIISRKIGQIFGLMRAPKMPN